jgi:hypothetical protein
MGAHPVIDRFFKQVMFLLAYGFILCLLTGILVHAGTSKYYQKETAMLKQHGQTIVLCGGRKCCPEMTELSDGKIQIKDDDGNIVTMEKSQAILIAEAVEQLTNKK